MEWGLAPNRVRRVPLGIVRANKPGDLRIMLRPQGFELPRPRGRRGV
jgi:hypothetical protein